MSKREAVLRWIEEQEALCQAATKGPWRTLGQGNDTIAAGHLYSDGSGESWYLADMERVNGLEQSRADARFIVASRSVLPLALAALRAEVEAHTYSGPNGRSGWNQWRCCVCGARFWDGKDCPTIDRLFCSLGLGGEV